MALPDTVNTVYAVGSQVKSVDLNDIQEVIVDLHALVADGEYYRPARKRKIPVAGNFAVAGGTVGTSTAGAALIGSADAVVVVPIPVDVGERITLVEARVAGDPGTNQKAVLKVFRVDVPAGGLVAKTQLGVTDTAVGSTAHETLTSGAIAEDVSDSNDYHYIAEFTCPTFFDLGPIIDAIYVTTTRPAP